MVIQISTLRVKPKKSLVPGDNYNFELKNETRLFYLKFSGVTLVSIHKSDFSLKP